MVTQAPKRSAVLIAVLFRLLAHQFDGRRERRFDGVQLGNALAGERIGIEHDVDSRHAPFEVFDRADVDRLGFSLGRKDVV